MTFVMAKTKDTQQVTSGLHEQQPCQSVLMLTNHSKTRTSEAPT